MIVNVLLVVSPFCIEPDGLMWVFKNALLSSKAKELLVNAQTSFQIRGVLSEPSLC